MSTLVTRADRAAQFRTRLAQAMRDADSNQSALARAIGTDRSTLSQTLTDDGTRLPSAHVVSACAAALGVSSDWLLGLSDRPESVADLVSASMSLTQAPRALVDEQIFAWHQEAKGYKIRHVPAALPDMLKTHEMLDWEYSPHLGRTAAQAITASSDRLEWMRSAQSDYEIALPLFEMQSFAAGTSYYRGLPASIRLRQIDRLLELCTQLYPRLRLYLFDARALYSAPITVFGPLLAVLYTGGQYMAFRDRERIEILTNDFDNLVREAAISARDLPAHLEMLRGLVR